MPELEVMDTSSSFFFGDDDDDNNIKAYNTDPLEPTFLKDEDYPPGWLVYDPILGIISKEELDKHHQQQKQLEMEPQEQPVQPVQPQEQPVQPVQPQEQPS